jgi:SET domain-containing protein
MRYSFYEEDFKYVIDATSGGNHTRFINHSNEPNVEIKSAIVKNLLRIIVIAIKPIKKEEQLLCHYGDEYWQDLKVKHGL